MANRISSHHHENADPVPAPSTARTDVDCAPPPSMGCTMDTALAPVDGCATSAFSVSDVVLRGAGAATADDGEDSVAGAVSTAGVRGDVGLLTVASGTKVSLVDGAAGLSAAAGVPGVVSDAGVGSRTKSPPPVVGTVSDDVEGADVVSPTVMMGSCTVFAGTDVLVVGVLPQSSCE